MLLGGDIVVNIPGPMWIVVERCKGFEGIKPPVKKPKPLPQSNGSYNLRLTVEQHKIFQANLMKAQNYTILEWVPGYKTNAFDTIHEDSLDGSREPSPEDEQTSSSTIQEEPSTVSVTQDPSMLSSSIQAQPYKIRYRESLAHVGYWISLTRLLNVGQPFFQKKQCVYTC